MEIVDLNFLVAEDDAFQRRWMNVMLSNLGAGSIVEASSGLAALDLLLDPERRIDVSIIDLSMAGMDGIELIRHLAKDQHPTSVILVSALDSALLFSVEVMSKAYGIDMLGAIAKPATPEALEALIRQYRPPRARQHLDAIVPQFALAAIQRGLAAREFTPLFQPKVELATGQVKGVEAFARWRHPEFGIIAPAAFIPVLEEQGDMEVLAWTMIEHSVAACLAWLNQGLSLTCSINVSPLSLEKDGFAERLAHYVLQHGLDPQYLILEVTESAAVTNEPCFLENIARLRMKGFNLSVDDFGAGHSSMQQLLRIPFSELKIDRSFVSGASQNHFMEMVLSSSFELCRKLNRQSVAVGVETRQDWDFLVKLGCSCAQGYYIARPMEASVIPGWMTEWSQFF